MSAYLSVLIEWLRQYGIGLLGAAIILQTNGIPIGANFMVMAAGAFAYAGEYSLGWLALMVWAFLVTGDITSYLIWRFLGNRMNERFPTFRHSIQPRLHKAGRFFDKYGALTITFTRFPVSALSLAINIISGTTNFKLARFMLAAALGELLWAAFNLGVGYWFGDSWEDIGPLLPAAGQWIALLLVLLLVIYYLKRVITNHRHKTND
ncbi:MAG: VTT domain-containing protein [Syntrophomonadaceae bacterium]